MQNETNGLAWILRCLADKAESGKMTLDEANSMYDAIVVRSELWATIPDIARLFNQSEQNVRSLLNRKYIGKPKRRVYYSLNQIQRIAPNTWWRDIKVTVNQGIK